MKNKTKKIVIPALIALATLSVGIGSTAALFTSESTTNIAVTSSTVDLNASLGSLVLYTPKLVDPSDSSIIDDTNIADGLNFGCGGTATLDTSTLTLTNMIPGDKATVTLSFDNQSNIDIKYKVVYEDVTEYTGSETYKLIDVLDVKVDSSTVISPTTIVDWTIVTAGSTIDSLDIVVELPTTVNNNYKNLTSKLKFTVYAVQSNAYTESEPTDTVWWNPLVTGLDNSDATTVNFTQSYTPTASDLSWDAPHNLTAYYDNTAKTLNYLLVGDAIVLDDEEDFVFGMIDHSEDYDTPEEQEQYFYNVYMESVNEVCGTSFTNPEDAIAYMYSLPQATQELIEEVVFSKIYEYFFNTAVTITGVDLFDVSNLTSLKNMFAYCGDLVSIDGLDAWDVSNVTDMTRMFFECDSITDLTSINHWNTSNVTTFKSMFYECNVLTDLDVSYYNTSNCTSFSEMFYSCINLTTLDVSNFNTANATTFDYMFYNCNNVEELDVSHFDTSKATNFRCMFSECNTINSLSLSDFNTSLATDMSYMFNGCKSISELILTSFDTSNCTAMEAMFNGCTNLTTLNVTSFDTSKVTDMESLFSSCTSIQTIDISSFSSESVFESASRVLFMFSYDSNLETIYASDKFDFGDYDEKGVYNVSYGCEKLVGGNGTTYNVNQGVKYLHIDGKNGKPGYFTEKTK